jgi:hypothetical protein
MCVRNTLDWMCKSAPTLQEQEEPVRVGCVKGYDVFVFSRDQYLQLGLCLRLLKHILHLGSLHDIALDLELPAHKQLLCIRLARDQLREILVGQDERDGGLLALGRKPFADGPRLLEVEMPRLFLAAVLEREAEDGAALLDGVFAVRWRGERRGNGVEGFRRGEVGCEVRLLVVGSWRE